MTLLDILNIDGIVIRKIPIERTYHYYTSDKMLESHKARGGETIVNESGRELMVEQKTFSMGGKYLITFEFSQGSMVRFDLKRNGIGNTIEEAYADFHNKGGTV
jgi:hypothetical protein